MIHDPTVFVVDDDSAVRESLGDVVRQMGVHVQCFETAQEFLDRFDRSLPGCLVLDIRMPGMTGLELQDWLNTEEIRLPIIFFSGHGDIPISVGAIKSGAVEFLEKPCPPQQLRESIRASIEIDAARRREDCARKQAQSRFLQLTPDERSVVDRIVQGMQNKQIALELEVSVRTVQLRYAEVMCKVGVDSRAALIHQAILSGEWAESLDTGVR